MGRGIRSFKEGFQSWLEKSSLKRFAASLQMGFGGFQDAVNAVGSKPGSSTDRQA